MTARRPLKQSLLAVAIPIGAALVGLTGIAPADAAPSSSDPVTISVASAGGNYVWLTTAAAYPLKDISSADCTFDGTPVTCGLQSADGKKATTYSDNLFELSPGSHTYTVDVYVYVQHGHNVVDHSAVATVSLP